MKQLRFGRLALASLMARKKEYLTLTMGILLAITLVFTLLVSAFSHLHYQEMTWRQAVGFQDMIIFDAAAVDKDALLTGAARAVGTVSLVGQVPKQDVAIGYLDEAAQGMMKKRLLQGRMPDKTDEIALEKSALLRLRLPDTLGATISLSLSPFESADDKAVTTRDFTLVGILQEQSLAQRTGSWYAFSSAVTALPAGLVAPQPPVPGGRAVLHLTLVTRPGMDEETIRPFLPLEDGRLPLTRSYLWDPFEGPDRWQAVLIMGVGLGALILCAVIGILNAFNNRLKQRESQIGMLRAVGATRRQIRALYGREALLIALLTAPAALALSLGLSAAMMRFTTGAKLYLPFYLIPAGLLLSLIFIMLAAFLPLRRAGSLSPLVVIRDQDLMRHNRRRPIKSKKHFDPASLLARRATMLGGRSLTGISLLVALCMLLTTIVATLPYMLVHNRSSRADRPTFSLDKQSGWSTRGGMVTIFGRAPGLSEADAQDLAALPLVRRVAYSGEVHALLLTENPSDYLTRVTYANLGDIHNPDKVRAWYRQTFSPEETERIMAEQRQNYDNMRRFVGTDRQMVDIDIMLMDEGSLKTLARHVNKGQLDVAKVNSGQELLAVALDRFEMTDGKGVTAYEARMDDSKTLVRRLTNDSFQPGDQLSLLQLYRFTDEDMAAPDRDLTSGTVKNTASPRVGAVIDGLFDSHPQLIDDLGYYRGQSFLVTTPRGAEAMGLLTRGLRGIQLHLDRAPDRQEEAALMDQIVRIAQRDTEVTVYNRMASDREWLDNGRKGIALFASLVVVFFTLALSLINNHLSGRMQAQRRQIGSLRALGADRAMLSKSFVRQLGQVLLSGALLGFLASAAYALHNGNNAWNPYPTSFYLLVLGLNLALVAALFVLAYVHLKSRINTLLRHSVISQIREVG